MEAIRARRFGDGEQRDAFQRWRFALPYAMSVPAYPVPYHPSASHVTPDYRDGFNAALQAVQEASVIYSPCVSHMRHNYSLNLKTTVCAPLRSVCPICEGLATNVEGPIWR